MDPAIRRLHQAADGMQRSRFPGAVCADEGNDLTLVYLKADILNRVDGAVIDLQPLYCKHGCQIIHLPGTRQ